MQDEQQPDLVGLSAEIVSAYVAKNHIQSSLGCSGLRDRSLGDCRFHHL
jgi:predicted transcriptional regulator